MRHGELTGICNKFATFDACKFHNAAQIWGLPRQCVFLCEFDAPRKRRFYVKVVGIK